MPAEGVAVVVVGAEEGQRRVFADPAVLARHEGVVETGDDLFVLTVLVLDGGPLDVGVGQKAVGLLRRRTQERRLGEHLLDLLRPGVGLGAEDVVEHVFVGFEPRVLEVLRHRVVGNLDDFGIEVRRGLSEGGGQGPRSADIGVGRRVAGVGVLPLAGVDVDVLEGLAELDLERDRRKESIDRLAQPALGGSHLGNAGLDHGVGRLPRRDIREDVFQAPRVFDWDLIPVFVEQLFFRRAGDPGSSDGHNECCDQSKIFACHVIPRFRPAQAGLRITEILLRPRRGAPESNFEFSILNFEIPPTGSRDGCPTIRPWCAFVGHASRVPCRWGCLRWRSRHRPGKPARRRCHS